MSPTCLCSSCGVAPPPPNCTGGRIWTGFACACPTGQVFTDTQCYAPVTVTEFFALGLNHYFITANDDEVTALNAPGTGWMPTGQTFKAYLRNVRPASAHSVCRFYGDFVIGPNSHFYTGEQAECDSLKALQAATPLGVPRWNFEELAFSVSVPAAGACPAGTTPVYRAYNNKAQQNDSNHRYMTSLTLYSQMQAAGWKPEGIVMCAIL